MSQSWDVSSYHTHPDLQTRTLTCSLHHPAANGEKGVRSLKKTYLMSRLCSVGIALVLLALTGFAIWTGVSTDAISSRTRAAIQLSDLYNEAHHLVGAEETIDWH